MPFIRGHYHINPIAGAALEAAREAEEALLGSRQAEHSDDASSTDDGSRQATTLSGAKGPIHRVEIEAAEVVPAHSGRAQRGFVARVHRTGYSEPEGQTDADSEFLEQPSAFGARSSTRAGAYSKSASVPGKTEAHVFSDHQDLVDFLQNELAKDCRR